MLGLHTRMPRRKMLFFFNDTATTEIYTLSLHDALPISYAVGRMRALKVSRLQGLFTDDREMTAFLEDRKSTRLNSSHGYISYAVFCLKKKRRTITSAPPHSCADRVRTSTRPPRSSTRRN